MSDPDLEAMAADELKRALDLTWRQLSRVTPWGDDFEGVSPSGRNVVVERAYVWASEPQGDILCEVRVFANASLYDEGAAVSAMIAKG